MAFKPTPEQQQALDAKGQVLVSAAAGSGKTAVLVERVASQLTDTEHPIGIDQLLVVTFTKAAATEMWSRINVKLLEKMRENPENLHLRRQQMLLSKAHICTMDSFCISLVREYFYRLDISPDFKTLDKAVQDQIESETLSAVINSAFAQQTPDFAALIQLLGSKADYVLPEYIKKLDNYLRTLPFPKQYMQYVQSLYTDFDFKTSLWSKGIFEETQQEAALLLSQAKSALLDIQNNSLLIDCFESTLLALCDTYKQIEVEAKECNWDKVANLIDNSPFEFSAAGKVDKDEKQAYNSMKAVVEKLKKNTISLAALYCEREQDIREDIQRCLPAIRALFSITEQYRESLLEKKKQRNGYDFADIENMALELLAENRDGEIVYTELARELSSQFHEVLVDEYQDTNDLQNTIFKALSDDGGHLFKVGDVKQSIYRFRQANPENFLRDRENFPLYDGVADPCKVLMNGNFRSAPEICGFINDIFRLLMSKTAGEIDYTEDEKLDPLSKFEDLGCRVSVDILDGADEDEKAPALEGRRIAQFIKETMQKGPIIRDKETLREANFSDFAILMRSCKKEDVSEYVKQLRAAGIPVWVDEKEGFLQSREIVVILSLLQVIDNPAKDVPLLTVMLSGLYQFTPDEVASMRIGHTEQSLYATLLCAKDNPKVSAFLAQIDRFRKAAAGMSVEVLLRRIYEQTGILLMVQMQKDGAQSRANLLLLLDYARAYEESQRRGLSRFLRYLTQAQKDGSDIKRASVINESDDVVRIMTMHHSKGLQFPVCIIAGLGKRFNMRDLSKEMLLQENFGLGLKIHSPDGKCVYNTLPHRSIALEMRRKMISEELRVLYVAMTRAQDRLHLVMTKNNLDKALEDCKNDLQAGSEFSNPDTPISPSLILQSSGFSKWLLYVLLLHPDGQVLRERCDYNCNTFSAHSNVEITVSSDLSEPDNETVEEARESGEFDSELAEQIKTALEFEYPYAHILQIPAKQTASELAHSQTEEQYAYTKRPLFLSSEGLSAAQKGTAQHAFMQHANFKSAAEDLSAEIDRLVENGSLTPQQADSIDHSMTQKFLQSNLCKRMLNSTRLMREQSFLVELPATQLHPELDASFADEKVVLQGVADCVFEEDGKLVIVDYKTDRVKTGEELISRYNIQLHLYKQAMEATTGMEVAGCEIYSFCLGESISV